MTREVTLPCPTCDGDGFVSYGDRHVENRTEVCGTCGGLCVVPAATGLTPQTSAAPDGGLHPDRRVKTGVPNVVSPHSGD